MPRKRTPTTYNAKARRRLRQMLHDDLDRLLNGETQEPDGTKMTALDSMTMRGLEGFGFAVSVRSLTPAELTGGVKEKAGTVEPGPQIGLVRGGPLDG